MTAFSLEALRELIRHMEWADASVWRALQTHGPSSQDARLRELLLHLHGVQRGFLAIWTAQPRPSPTVEYTASLHAMQQGVRSYYADLAKTIEGFDDATLTRPIEMPGLAPFEERMGRRFDKPTLAETIFQVTSHSTYHRGQVNARLREIGGEPPLVDYIAWIWFGRPAADWTAPVNPSGVA